MNEAKIRELISEMVRLLITDANASRESFAKTL